MSASSSVRSPLGTVLLAVLVILSLSATAALAGAPAAPLFQSPLPMPPANDDFANAILIDTLPFSRTVDASAATTESGEPVNCISMGSTIWYQLTPAASGTYHVNTQGSSLYQTAVAVWQGDYPNSFTPVACGPYSPGLDFAVQAGATYYIQLGISGWSDEILLALNVSLVPPPPNDSFPGTTIRELPHEGSEWILGANWETDEPVPSCAGDYTPSRSIWYSYTPTEDVSLSAYATHWYYNGAFSVYTGDTLTGLQQLTSRCVNFSSGVPVVIAARKGVTYRFQLTNIYASEYGTAELRLGVTPPPVVGFYWSIDAPSKYDLVSFEDSSYDPINMGITGCWWDFGDGTGAAECSVTHQYAADGDYPVWHKVETSDGRTAEMTQVLTVGTHDVAITKFNVPQSASAGQTRQIVVGVRNYNYTEDVRIELYKSIPNDYAWVGSLRQQVAVRSGNRTTDFNFSYTFTGEDARIGKLTFRAVAVLENARDALPADNEAISLPIKVQGK